MRRNGEGWAVIGSRDIEFTPSSGAAHEIDQADAYPSLLALAGDSGLFQWAHVVDPDGLLYASAESVVRSKRALPHRVRVFALTGVRVSPSTLSAILRQAGDAELYDEEREIADRLYRSDGRDVEAASRKDELTRILLRKTVNAGMGVQYMFSVEEATYDRAGSGWSRLPGVKRSGLVYVLEPGPRLWVSRRITQGEVAMYWPIDRATAKEAWNASGSRLLARNATLRKPQHPCDATAPSSRSCTQRARVQTQSTYSRSRRRRNSSDGSEGWKLRSSSRTSCPRCSSSAERGP